MHATQSICSTSLVQAIHYDFRPNELISLYVDELELWTVIAGISGFDD